MMLLQRHGRFWVLLAAMLIALGCGNSSSQPSRPASVPTAAFWLGGPDGGVFVLLKPRDDKAPATRCAGTIYRQDGSVWYTGAFAIDPASSPPVNTADHKLFEGWDGTQLLLRDGRALVAAPAKRRAE